MGVESPPSVNAGWHAARLSLFQHLFWSEPSPSMQQNVKHGTLIKRDETDFASENEAGCWFALKVEHGALREERENNMREIS